jgi:FixJ family two-component response regulator
MPGAEIREASPSVVIIDDDAEFANSVVRLLRSVGLDIQQFSSVADFSKAKLSDGPSCLVLDVRMPGRSGLELQRDLAAANRLMPIIFITAHADVPMTVQAMKGAIEFLTKPFRDQELLDAVQRGSRAIVRVGRATGDWLRSRSVSRHSSASGDHGPCDGRPPQQADCERHRHCRIHGEGASHHLMRKMKARSLPELSRMADVLS